MLKSELVHNSKIDLQKWDMFIAESSYGAVYHYSWYLNAICHDWSAVIVTEDDVWVSVLPLDMKSSYGISYALQPAFAQFLGIVFKNWDAATRTILEKQKQAIKESVAVLDRLKVFNNNFGPEFKYFSPFRWSGYQVEPRITYHLNLERSYEEIKKGFSSRIKNDIRTAVKNKIQCRRDNDPSDLLKLAIDNGIINTESGTKFKKLYDALSQRELVYCIYASDDEGKVHCGAAFVKNKKGLILLLMSTSKELRKYGSTSLMLTYAIEHEEDAKYFDFEGSMIEGIDFYFRAYNPEPSLYYNISKNKIPLLFGLYKKLKGK